ncbi:N-acetylglucosaminyl transferase component-domain-containing protein [Gloeopeniophorella convolvens]|nr:N-acetylglucosaminyl transferase component-domain-containing protein [Gloeopeniophorella convolvens]
MTANCSIFWPIEDEGKSGFCYGWAHGRLVCVAGVLPVASDGRAKAILDDFLKANPRFVEVSSTEPPVILGKCSFDTSSRTPNIELLSDVGPSLSTLPRTLVMYRRSALGSARFRVPENAGSGDGPAAPDAHPTFEAVGLDETALTQLNAAYRLHSLFNLPGSWLSKLKLLDIAARHVQDTIRVHAERTSSRFRSGFTFTLGTMAQPLQRGRSWAALAGVYSTSAEQIWARARLVQGLVSFPRLSYVYGKLETSAEYVRFNNALWLVMNDVILGSVVGAFVCENRVLIGTSLHDWLKTAFIDFTREALLWLDDWPAGLKLNTELSSFLVQVFLGVLELWAYILRSLSPHFPTIVYAVGLSGYGGLTIPLSLSLDIFNALTQHISLSHLGLTSALSYEAFAMRSLWNLFRGKRFNVLHRHTDSWHYEIDQLILGTLLFTLFAFCLPTLLTYAALFVLMRSGVVIAQGSAEATRGGVF